MAVLNFKGKSFVQNHHLLVKCIYIDPPYNTGNENWSHNRL